MHFPLESTCNNKHSSENDNGPIQTSIIFEQNSTVHPFQARIRDLQIRLELFRNILIRKDLDTAAVDLEVNHRMDPAGQLRQQDEKQYNHEDEHLGDDGYKEELRKLRLEYGKGKKKVGFGRILQNDDDQMPKPHSHVPSKPIEVGESGSNREMLR
jgi:hypothetical protein